ncbi:MAG: hypothetical protein H0W36_10455 [Gemmatimonadetes bacterium]|nr:hypothetical protein [Gemmatimonadota bacterium]
MNPSTFTPVEAAQVAEFDQASPRDNGLAPAPGRRVSLDDLLGDPVVALAEPFEDSPAGTVAVLMVSFATPAGDLVFESPLDEGRVLQHIGAYESALLARVVGGAG